MWREHRLGKPQGNNCEMCGKNISGGKVKLQEHIATHTGAKDHVCHICGAGFLRLTSLKHHTQQIHERTHTYKKHIP